jgi:glutamate N-acetyltransferase/amino-acid N-acetyltransferase
MIMVEGKITIHPLRNYTPIMSVSPLAPSFFPELPAINGIRLAVANSGIRYKERPDLLLMECAEGTTAAGVLTMTSMPAAPVEWCREVLKNGGVRALVANAGNANAFTGKKGVQSVHHTAQAAAALFGCAEQDVFIASTGVIGVPLPEEKITAILPALHNALSADNWEAAARAIMTTDTFKKIATRTVQIDGVAVTINGIAKGSGMIAPDMATLLSFLATDAAIPAVLLQSLLSVAIARSFNAITVDSDTSTNDTALLFATGKAQHKAVTRLDDPHLAEFKAALESILIELAQLVVKDGEGASKFVTITVEGAATETSARKIALSIANSPLVKTAIAGEDANWGRIVMAVGKSGEKADRDRLRITIGGVLVAVDGAINPAYVEAPTAAYMTGDIIDITVDVGVGQAASSVWTCDLTHGYIDINADYRS